MSEREMMAGTSSAQGAARSPSGRGRRVPARHVLAIARGGLLVAGALAYALGVKNTFTMNVEFYTGIDERLEMPMILPPVPDLVDFAETRVLIADDVADTGATLELVKELLRGQGRRGAVRRAVREAALDGACEYVWRRTDRWIDFPWSARRPGRERAARTRLSRGSPSHIVAAGWDSPDGNSRRAGT